MKDGHPVEAMTRLKFDERGLRLELEQSDMVELEWGSVLEVFAFKDDVFAYDIFCIGFRTDDTGKYLKIDEKCDGYESLLSFLPRVFPGIRTDWFSDVAFPVFETRVTTLWGTGTIAEIWERGATEEKTSEVRPLADDAWGLDPGVTPKSLGGAMFQAIVRIFRSRNDT